MEGIDFGLPLETSSVVASTPLELLSVLRADSALPVPGVSSLGGLLGIEGAILAEPALEEPVVAAVVLVAEPDV